MKAIQETLALCKQAHEGQVDKAGLPYWQHPVRVMWRLRHTKISDVARHAALLHDVVEDTAIRLDDLRSMGHTDEVVTVIDLLTKRQDQTHDQYLTRLLESGNVDALLVKLADNYDNTAPNRSSYLDSKPYLRAKYEDSIARITDALERLQPGLARLVVSGSMIYHEQTDDEFLAEREVGGDDGATISEWED